MEKVSYAVLLVVAISWISYAVGIYFRKKDPGEKHKKTSDPRSWIGSVLQASGFLTVFFYPRPLWTSFTGTFGRVEFLISVFVIIACPLATWLGLSATFNLGKQWNFGAKLVDNHQLITSGPYQIVRHPIYTALFTILISTGVALSSVWPEVIAIILFLSGTIIRIQVEDQLLRRAFPTEFDEYAHKTPAILPGSWFKSAPR